MWSNYFYKWFSKQINNTYGFELGVVRMKKKKKIHVNKIIFFIIKYST